MSIRAADLPNLLARAPQGLKYLSLDCFDTLIWRNVSVPVEVFADLPLDGGAMDSRIWAERRARRLAPHVTGRNEVTLDDIHAQLMPRAPQIERDEMIVAELDAEARHCFAFAPAWDLILDARRRGLKVIIVSNTYLPEPRIRDLIEQIAGKERADMIDRIFCSCDYGVSKEGGLFAHVLLNLLVPPEAMLHVGDDKGADQIAPARLGIHTAHFEQFDEEARQRLRLEAAVAALIEPSARVTAPVLQPHRAQVALRRTDDPAYAMGHDILGPLMHGFATWIAQEADAMEARLGKPVKLLFLLRDGHLPAQAFRALFPDRADRVAAVEISRFTATAASFTDGAAIKRYMLPELVPSLRSFSGFTSQMLFDRNEAAALSEGASLSDFGKRVTLPANIAKIVSRSGKFADRLFAHLRHHGVEDGDAVMLVDLGYTGSAQNLVEPVLRDGMKLEVAGRYLLLREMSRTGLDKRGYFDVRHYDSRLLNALSESIAIVEQLCTVEQGSVVDYRPDGTAVRGDVEAKGAQSAHRATAQEACLAFVRAAGSGIVRPPLSDDADARRQAAIASLGRFLFLPIASEVAVLEDFHHDLNLSTSQSVRMVDLAAGSEGLRRRGLFYTRNAARIYLPGELQRHGLPINLSTLSARRFGLELSKSDFDVGGIQIPVELIDADGQATVMADAYPTADGYYQALIPVGEGRFTVGLWLGRAFDYVQIEELCFQPVSGLLAVKDEQEIIAASPLFDAMEEVAPGLYRADGPKGFMLVPPPAIDVTMVLSFVFRPIISRTPQVQQQIAS
jgi:FMN phosphatase YigB (HAD superfamily)